MSFFSGLGGLVTGLFNPTNANGAQPPSAPNLAALLAQQGQINMGVFNQQLGAGRVNQSNPYGYSSWTPPSNFYSGGVQSGGGTTTPGGGAPGTATTASASTSGTGASASSPLMGGAIPQPTGPWTQNQGFSQPVQNVVDPALAGAGAAASSFNAGNNPTYQGPGAADAANLQFQPANVAQSLYGQQMGLLEPGMKSQSDALDNSLKAMGYDTNSAGGAQTAENNLMNQQNLVRTQAANTAVGQAIPQGAQALAAQEGILGLGQSLGTTQFNTGMQSQLLPIQEAQGLTQTALAPSATLPGGAAQVPAIQPVDALGTAQQSYANQVAGYNANQATSSNNMNGLLGLAGTIGSIFMSDRSLKTDIAPVAERADGLNVYNYRYKWDQPGTRRTGLMADEVKKLYPNAVLRTPSGYDAVDYARV